MKYQTFVDYYRAIRQHSHNVALSQRSALKPTSVSSSSSSSASSASSGNQLTILPNNQREIILGADEAMLNANLENFNTIQHFRTAFIVFSVILNNVYRNTIKAQRKKTINAIRANGTAAKSSDEEHPKEESDNEITSSGGTPTKLPKITREQCIPDAFNMCHSNVSKAAVALFCMNGIRGATRLNILYNALDGEFQNVTKTIKFIGQVKEDASILKTIANREPNKVAYPLLVQTLLELAELTRDKSPAKLAYSINEEIYLLALQHLIKHNLFDNIFPYEPLIVRYLHDCVAPINVTREQITINNQFKLDPARTINYLLEAIPKTPYKHAPASPKFDNNKTYEVFIGQVNYIHNVMVTYVPHEGRNYRTIMYNDCLYDVIGCSIERLENGVSLRDSILFDNMPWSERLALLPYRAKIKLETMTGEQLNAFRGTASLKVSWMENNHECSKIYTFKNEGGNKKDDMANNSNGNNNNNEDIENNNDDFTIAE
nr:GrBNV gp83-like protein [Apis mellifera nudivirus]